ncbi:MAG TPA: HD domain-containing phosphohydrolase [Mycobacteriales bacterium]|nr:HD domain-containing phosphohydrolase [Mycobacteriales bacterium]
MSTATLDRDARILVVDDEEAIRRVLTRMLEREGYSCRTAEDGAACRAALAEQPVDLVLCDVNMPGENGFDVLAHMASNHPDTAVIMVTAYSDEAAAGPASLYRADGYILKPFERSEILVNVASALRRRQRQTTVEQTAAQQGAALADAIIELDRAGAALKASDAEAVRRLAGVAEWRDSTTGRHLERMSIGAAHLAHLAGLDPEHCELLEAASVLHDIGKVAIPDAILQKPGKLTDEERTIMQTHAAIGAQMLAGSDSPLLRMGALIAETHHERYDGTGYPHRIAADDIPIEGRIVAIADVYDALRSERQYKPAFTQEEAVQILLDSRGTHLDPHLVDLFVADLPY